MQTNTDEGFSGVTSAMCQAKVHFCVFGMRGEENVGTFDGNFQQQVRPIHYETNSN